MDRGSSIHKLAEDYVKGTIRNLPPELKSFAAEFKVLRKEKAIAEEQWAFTAQWGMSDWFGPSAWLRVMTDASLIKGDTLRVIDYKTGKEREEHKLQLELYQLAGLLRYPDIQKVSAELWYLDLGKIAPEETSFITRDKLNALKLVWMKRTKAMLSDTRFAPKPGNYCRWCHWRKDNGGPCQF
jgi:CRISPR/Cas system-associated exonuclease Cas4 (RecB family)